MIVTNGEGVLDGKTGYMVEPDNLGAIADAVIAFLNKVSLISLLRV